jgi:hypothetical protein
MNATLKSLTLFTISISALVIVGSCKSDTNTTPQSPEMATTELSNDVEKHITKPFEKPSKEFNDYWYAGEAEISSYKLEQARYGEIRNGNAVLVFVTEDFLPEVQVKADNYNKDNTSVLKLNATKNFNTGIYPYSIMQSTFYPVANNDHAIKVTASVQEWCGQAYTQINNRSSFEVKSHSYFQGEADQDFKIDKAITENELWTQLRINPETLPVGSLEVIPSLEYIRLKHIELKAYKAMASLQNGTYAIVYPELKRSLEISFNTNFPYEINSWKEKVTSGYGANEKTMTTTATKLETIKSAYWTKNSNADQNLRTILQLD